MVNVSLKKIHLAVVSVRRNPPALKHSSFFLPSNLNVSSRAGKIKREREGEHSLAIIFIYTVHALRLDIDVINRSYRVHFVALSALNVEEVT